MQNNYYIYIHRDLLGEVFYVGRGEGDRAKLKTNRNKKHLSKMLDGFTIEYLYTNLSTQDATKIESDLLLNPPKDWNLTNISKIYKQFVYDPLELSEYFELDSNSPSGLMWTEGSLIKIKRRKTSRIVGRLSSHGYYYVTLKGNDLPCHRIVWCLYNNRVPDSALVIDHVDGNRTNNNPLNLEQISQRQNIRRGKHRSRNTGENNIGWDSARTAWRIQWRENRKVKSKRFLVRDYTGDTFESRKAEVLLEAKAFAATLFNLVN